MSANNTGNPCDTCTKETTCSAAKRSGTFSQYLRAVCGLLTLAVPASLVAQTHFCIGGDIDDLTPAKAVSCQAKMAAVRAAVMQYGAPADWHFVVVCDEAGWKEYASFSGKKAAHLEAVGYSTDPQLRWTFLRGSDLDPADPDSTAQMLDVALSGLPRQKAAPRQNPAEKASRRMSIAMSGTGDAAGLSR